MISVFTATATELAELKPIGRGLLILGRYVVAAFACTTLKNNIIAWHNLILILVLRFLYLVLGTLFFELTLTALIAHKVQSSKH
jgi:hypothetical protein